jgi:hypothetical protein
MIALGLVAAVALNVGTVYLVMWTARRQAAVQADPGGVGQSLDYPSALQLLTRHGLSATASFIALFALLNLIDVPFGQQVLIAIALGGMFASFWLQGEKDRWLRRVKASGGPAITLTVRQRTRVAADWFLVWVDWFSFIVALCFLAELVWRIGG